MSRNSKTNWFTVDREGLRELHGNVPPERLVLGDSRRAFRGDF